MILNIKIQNIKNKSKKINGITLIALVITIILLLIFAGVSISALTGQNGLLKMVSEASEKTEVSTNEEKRKLAQIEALTSTTDIIYNGVIIPKGFAPTKISGEDSVDVGLVITDENGNEYVWVEVSKSIYENTIYNSNNINKPSSSTDYEKIESCLKSYTSDYKNEKYSDINPEFLSLYQNMLKSVYENGGFWIGRYEAGLEEGKAPRTEYTAIQKNDTFVIKPNMYPYNFLKRDDAQSLATNMNHDNCTSSLLFGLQYDLVFKYIETKMIIKDPEIKTKLIFDSTPLGNYFNSEFTLNRGKFAHFDALSDWYEFNKDDLSGLVKESKKIAQSNRSNAIILTTGAAEVSKLQNIYDIAGNVWEWTLEFYNTDDPCVIRVGGIDKSGLERPSIFRAPYNTGNWSGVFGFRIGVWKQ